MRKALCVAVLLLSGCGTAVQRDPSPVSGSMFIREAGGAERRLTADICRTGEAEMFHGLDLGSTDDSRLRIRAVVDPIEGPVVRIDEAGEGDGKTTILRRDVCRLLDVTLIPTGWQINEYRDVDGRVEFECTTADGALFDGKFEIRNCH